MATPSKIMAQSDEKRHSYSPENLSAIMNTSANHTSENTEPFHKSNSGGLVQSTKRWLYSQKMKRQKQALQKAVEEQRQILLKVQKEHQTLHAFAEENGVDISDRDLNHNATFQSLTNHTHRLVTHNLVGALCGTSLRGEEDEDEEYVIDVEQSDDGTSQWDGDSDSNDAANNNQEAISSSMTDDASSLNARIDMVDDDVFRIRSPSHTHTGGLAVHLEFRETLKKPPPRDFVKVQEEKNCNIPFILSLEEMTDIAESGLPNSIMFTRWKRLYSLQRDGDSFTSSFLRKVKDQTRTLLVVQTTNQEVMGAFCNSPWECQGGSISAQFYGSAQACLFSIRQETGQVLVYKWTGKNRYIQVCDIQQKLIALGGGGKNGEFGLCIEDDFRVGSTGHCETFNNAPLCEKDQFEIMNVECWGFIPGFC